MVEENADETRIYFFEEIEQNELMSRKYKQVCTTVNYTEHFLIIFCNYGVYFIYCFCFFAWYSYRNYEICDRIKILSNSCRN